MMRSSCSSTRPRLEFCLVAVNVQGFRLGMANKVLLIWFSEIDACVSGLIERIPAGSYFSFMWFGIIMHAFF